jgi:transcription termination factor Rho
LAHGETKLSYRLSAISYRREPLPWPGRRYGHRDSRWPTADSRSRIFTVEDHSLSSITGWFDPAPKGGGALRRAAESYLPARGDPGVRLPGLRRGDFVVWDGSRVTAVNGGPPDGLDQRPEFAKLGAVHPSRPLLLETASPSSARVADIQRTVDLVCPLGFGQRALIVSPPKAGKTTVLQAVAEGVAVNHPGAELLILLVDERPEEVSEMVDWGRGEVIASSFDLPHERHVAVADMVFEHARRQVEVGKDVVIVLDSLTRLARSHNTAGRSSGRTMSGGIDANALAKPKALFGAARAVPDGGSLTVIATALVETESRMDDVIFEEFKGTGNAELRLVRALADRRVYPAVDIAASGTRREELLAPAAVVTARQELRRRLVGLPESQAMETLLGLLRRAKTNAELLGTP